MSFNPIPENSPPQWYSGEGILCSQKGVDFGIKLGPISASQRDCNYKARGTLHLSNVRILFVAARPTQSTQGQAFVSFDIPLRGIIDVKFNQPVFSANNLTGQVQPVNCLGVSQPIDFKASFTEGGTATFVPTLLRLMDQLSQERHAPRYSRAHTQADVPVAHALPSSAYVDPNNPSRVLVNNQSSAASPPMATASYASVSPSSPSAPPPPYP